MYFWTREFAGTGGLIFAPYDAWLTVAFSPSDFVMGVTLSFLPSRRNRAVDARGANLNFRAPESVGLPTAASFTKLEIQPGEALHCMQFDLADAF